MDNINNKNKYYKHKLQSILQPSFRQITSPSTQLIKSVTNVYIIAICGKAMASLAQLLVQQGYYVSGSDSAFYPPMSDVIAQLGVRTYKGYNKQNIINQKMDIIVVGNTVIPTNVQTTYARERKIPQISVAQALRYFIFKDRKVISIAGTHGKTTTAGLLAHVLTDCKLDPGYLIGGVYQDKLKSAYLGSGKYFVIEGDEYCTAYFDKSPKFLNYNTQSAIVTSIQMDHMNLYKDFQDYTQAFSFLIDDLPEYGYLIACGDEQIVKKLAYKSKSRVFFYGIKEQQQNEKPIQQKFVVKNIRTENNMQIADIYQNGKFIGKLETKLYGHYNMNNCLSVFVLAVKIGCDKNNVLDSIKTYSGMKKRQQILYEGTYNKSIITVIDDYAHHPTAVSVTLQGIRQKYQKQNLIVVFEFSSTSCKIRQFEEMYKNCFDIADYVILKQFALPNNIALGSELRPTQIRNSINFKNKKQVAFSFPQIQLIIDQIIKIIYDDSIIIFMSACPFDGIHKKFIQKLKN